jgi:hypothetical protein
MHDRVEQLHAQCPADRERADARDGHLPVGGRLAEGVDGGGCRLGPVLDHACRVDRWAVVGGLVGVTVAHREGEAVVLADDMGKQRGQVPIAARGARGEIGLGAGRNDGHAVGHGLFVHRQQGGQVSIVGHGCQPSNVSIPAHCP